MLLLMPVQGPHTLRSHIPLDACYSKCGPHTSSISISWELVRHIGSQTPPHSYWIWICKLTCSPGVSCVHWSLRSTAAEERSYSLQQAGWELYLLSTYEVGHGPCIWENSSLRSAHFGFIDFLRQTLFSFIDFCRSWSLPHQFSADHFNSFLSHFLTSLAFLPWH